MSRAAFRAYLVLDAQEPALDGLTAGLPIEQGLDQRPRAWLDLRDGRPHLVCEDRDKFFQFLDRQIWPGRDRYARALSLLPREQLEQVNGRAFFFGHKYYTFWTEPPSDWEPYYRRLVRITVGVEITGDLTETEVLEPAETPADDRDGTALWLEPVRLEVSDEGRIRGLYNQAAVKSLRRSFLLPPVRTRAHPDLKPLDEEPREDQVTGTYFSTDLIALRAKIRGLLPQMPQPGRSAALRILELVDDPLLRDLLLDGGRITLHGELGQPTRLHLESGGGDGPGAEYRRRTLFSPDDAVGPDWAPAICHALRNDVASLEQEFWDLRPSPEGERADWSVVSHARSDARGEGRGSLDLILALRNRLATPDDLVKFDENITLPARSGADQEHSDHAQAEKLFTGHVWRLPDAAALPPATYLAWRAATVEILKDDFGTTPSIAAAVRIARWNEAEAAAHPVDEEAPGLRCHFTWSPPRLRYSGNPNDRQVLTWRFLLPLGTIIDSRTLHLDRGAQSALDRGFVLAD